MSAYEGQDMVPPPGTTTSSLDSHTSMLNSRFWFDMYQRLKIEMSRERREFLDVQAQVGQDREEQATLAHQRISVLTNEKDMLEKINSSYLM